MSSARSIRWALPGTDQGSVVILMFWIDQEWTSVRVRFTLRVRILKALRKAFRDRAILRWECRNFLLAAFPSSGPKKIKVMAPITSNTPKYRSDMKPPGP